MNIAKIMKHFQKCFLWILLSLFECCSCHCPKQCVCDFQVMNCLEHMPFFIPVGIKSVKVYDPVMGQRFNFTHTCWKNVTHLSLGPKQPYAYKNQSSLKTLVDNEFSDLENLEYLEISCDCLEYIEVDAFQGLNRLKVLNLSNNRVLGFNSVLNAINGTMKNLTEFYLSGVASAISPIQPNNLVDFEHAVKGKAIKVLDISNNLHKLPFTMTDIFLSLPFLEKLNMSNSSLDIFTLQLVGYTGVCSNLKVLDISYSTPTAMGLPVNQQNVTLDMYFECIEQLKLIELHANTIFHSPARIVGGSNSTQLCVQNVLLLDNMYCVSVNVGTLEKLVIAENNIIFLEPEIWRGFASLKHLNIAKNRLGPAFSKEGYARSILDNLNRLEELVASENGISEIPIITFSKSYHLKHLDLSSNFLKSVTFDTSNLRSLEYLDLSYNRIECLDEMSIERLNNLFSLSKSNTTHNSTKIKINLDNNPFNCSNENIEFHKLIARLNVTNNNCKIQLAHNLIDKGYACKYVCLEKRAIVEYLVFGSVICALSALLVYFVIKARKRELIIKQLIQGKEKFQQENKADHIPPVFLSFCSEDDNTVFTEIYPNLNKGLQEVLNTNLRCVSTGYHDFRPGQLLAHEIIRCVERSAVIVFFVTNNFCQKPWCRNEALVAHNINKPTVLMMWEVVNVKQMPKHLHKCYREYVSIHWVKNNSQRTMKPSWEELCLAIVRLFAD